MSNAFFRFKQFTVWHDRCAMKVGTDGVLLGAWCEVEGVQSILDVGCGSGLISMMLAQRNRTADVTALDIDHAAVDQAAANFRQSPFAARLRAVETDFLSMADDGRRYDLVVCNPPFFTEQTQSPDAGRALARSAEALPPERLLTRAADLLTEEGRLAVIVPGQWAARWVLQASTKGLSLLHRTDVRSTPGKPVMRRLLEWGRKTAPTRFDSLTIHADDGSYSDEFRRLTEPFYIKW